jgi:hypothetical protein
MLMESNGQKEELIEITNFHADGARKCREAIPADHGCGCSNECTTTSYNDKYTGIHGE